MATFANTTSSASNGLGDRLLSLFPAMATAVRQRRTYAQTLRELNQLTDRELTDLGISRVSIIDIAREAAFGK